MQGSYIDKKKVCTDLFAEIERRAGTQGKLKALEQMGIKRQMYYNMKNYVAGDDSYKDKVYSSDMLCEMCVQYGVYEDVQKITVFKIS